MIENRLGKPLDLSQTAGEAGAHALLRAVEGGDANEVKTLIAGGVPADTPLPDGGTALTRAAALGFEDVACTLLDSGASIDAKRDDGFTPLLVASFRGHGDVVRLLLERGADPTDATRLGSTSRSWATAHSFKDVVDALEKAPIRPPTLQSTAASVKKSPLQKNKQTELASIFGAHDLSDKRSVEVDEPEWIIDQSENMGGARISSTSRRFLSSMAIVLPLVAIACAAYYIYSYNTRTRPSLLPTPPAQVTNATPETSPTVLPQTIVPPMPTPAASTQVVQPGSYVPVITLPAESRMPARSTGSSVPEVISERGVPASPQRQEQPGASERRPTPTPRPSENVRPEPGTGAEVRTAPTAPAPAAVASPTPSATPKKKVIPWP